MFLLINGIKKGKTYATLTINFAYYGTNKKLFRLPFFQKRNVGQRAFNLDSPREDLRNNLMSSLQGKNAYQWNNLCFSVNINMATNVWTNDNPPVTLLPRSEHRWRERH